MNMPEWATSLFQTIDNKDAEGFASYLTDNSSFVFSNAAPVVGKDNIQAAVDGFFGSIKALSHEIEDCWKNENSLVCSGRVTYTRHNETQLSVPFVDIFYKDGEKIKDYLIYIDISELYN